MTRNGVARTVMDTLFPYDRCKPATYGDLLNVLCAVLAEERSATDAELVAEMRKLGTATGYNVRAAYDKCADMLEKRSIKP